MPTDAASIRPTNIRRLQSGVQPAYAMLAGLQLDIFTALDDGQASAPAIATRIGVREDKLTPLLYALVLTGLLELDSDRFSNSAEAAEFLVRGKPRSMAGVHEAWADLWLANLRTAESIRAGKPKAAHDFSIMPRDQAGAFLRGLYPAAIAMGRRLATQFDFRNCRNVIDVGGGSGGTLIGLCETHAQLEGKLFDLASVTPIAAEIVSEQGYAHRITIESGDIVQAPPAGRYEAAVLCAVVQVLGPDDALRAIRNTVSVLEPGGTIFIIGRGILDNTRLNPPAAVFVNLTFLNLYEEGRAYTEAEHLAWLRECGCVEPQRITLDDGTGIILARRKR